MSNDDTTRLTYVVLYDTSDPTDVRLADLIEYRDARIDGALHDGNLVLVADVPYSGVDVVVLDVEEGELVEVARTEDIFAGTDAEYADEGLDDLLSNGERLVLVTEATFVELDPAAPDGPRIVRHVDRRADYVDFQWWWREKHVLTDDNHVLELGDGVAVWQLDPAPG